MGSAMPSRPDRSSPAAAAPRVESARPADRGLVARLLEAVVADDPSVAPEVASGAVRAAQWLQRTPADWRGVAVLDGPEGVREVVGYVAAPAGGGPELVLLHPAHRDPALAAALVAAARDALAVAPPPPVVVDEDEPEPEVVAVVAPPVGWRQRLLEPTVALGIVAAGVVAVLAVQVGTGPLRDVVPFLGGDRGSTAADGRGAGTPSASPSSDPSGSAGPAVDQAAAPVPGTVLVPVTNPAPGGSAGDVPPTGPGTPDPTTGPGTPPPAPPSTPPSPQPPRGNGPTSSLLDPVVAEVVEVVDGATGGALAPVTGVVQGAVDGVTDLLDGVLGVLLPTSAGSPRP